MPGGGPGGYPATVKTAAQRALYNNLGKDEGPALAVDAAIQRSRMDGWRGNAMKTKRVRLAIREALETSAPAAGQAPNRAQQNPAGNAYSLEAHTDQILELAKHQNDY
jgi:type I restriction enzyme R subunit